MEGNQQGGSRKAVPHKVVVTHYIPGETVTVVTDTFHHIAGKVQTPVGYVLVNADGETVGFFPYERILSLIAPDSDQPASLITPASVMVFPSGGKGVQ